MRKRHMSILATCGVIAALSLVISSVSVAQSPQAPPASAASPRHRAVDSGGLRRKSGDAGRDDRLQRPMEEHGREDHRGAANAECR
jgi:hypothetical protein